MQFLTILIPSTAIAWSSVAAAAEWRDHARRGLAAAMVVAGASHFARSEQFVQHLPGWVPAREALVFITGAVEIALGAALFFSGGHRVTIGRLLAAYLVAVFPANIYVAVADVDVTGQAGGAGVDPASAPSAVRRLGIGQHDAHTRPPGRTHHRIHTEADAHAGILSSTAPATEPPQPSAECSGSCGGSLLRATTRRTTSRR